MSVSNNNNNNIVHSVSEISATAENERAQSKEMAQKILGHNFNRPTYEEFWHYLAKNRVKKFRYKEMLPLQKKIEEIKNRLGECSFNRKAAFGFTPLHVAILSNNQAAVRFFLSQGAEPSIKNDEGMTPLNYSKDLKQNETILKIMLLRSMLPPVIPLPISTSTFTYQQNTNDFGIEIKDLLFSNRNTTATDFNEIHESVICVKQDLCKIAEDEGFKLSLTKEAYYPRDRFIWTKTGVITLAQKSESLKEAIEIALSKAAYFSESAQFCTQFIYLAEDDEIYTDLKHSGDSDQFSSHRSSTLSAYIEGGNLFTLTNKQGIKKILIGKDHFAQIHAQLRLEGYFENNTPKALGHPLSQDDIRKEAEEMYAMNFLDLSSEKGKKNGYLSPKIREDILETLLKLKNSEQHKYIDIAIKQGWVTPFSLQDKDFEEIRPQVVNYVAQKNAVLDALAKELGVASQDVHFIPQLAYHLDVFMKPGPNGSIFLQDFSVCVKILEQLQENNNFTLLALSQDDYSMLTKYLAMAKQLEKELGSLLQEATKELKQAGFTVIPTPGIFYDQHYSYSDQTGIYSSRTFHLNFLNAITGWSEKQKHYYYITTGVNAGTQLGGQLMRLFLMFLQQYQPGLKVYFVGKNHEKTGDFTKAMKLWNQTGDKKLEVGPLAGVHCLTIEKETKSHENL